ncbi:MAG: phosphoribosylformylglycinamidine cyclo-ligase [Leptolyngbyaceae bacterium]|nr:phosphoribosylformylglycinamidine cyclo-ligase [Leptolyngbyaceae bacterium]
MDYREAGVDVEAGRAFVDRIRQSVARTHRPGVVGEVGGFGGLFRVPTGYQDPILVSGTDGVGTKLKIAHGVQRHDTVGIDLVAMCVNDVLTCGAEPLFFLDYIATSALNPEQLAAVVEGISQGCQQAGCALLGGETAEMPGFYQPGEYDLAGFCVGIVDRPKMIDGSKIAVGDVAIALPSSGVHSNGFSLVRKILAVNDLGWGDRSPFAPDQTVGEVLLTPTQIYVKPILSLLNADLPIHGMAHITGGGLPENLPRCLQPDQAVTVDPTSWSIPPVFEWLEQLGTVERWEMFNTFNMGVGFVAIAPPTYAEAIMDHLAQQGIAAWVMGEVVPKTDAALVLI